MKLKFVTLAMAICLMTLTLGCTKQPATSYKDPIKTALEQADLKDVTVSEDADKNTITLGGTLHSEDAKQRAMDIAKANGGSRVIANEVSVQPVGMESEAKGMASNLDDGIESNFKAGLIEKGLDKQDISYKAKQGVLTLTGSVKMTMQRKEAADVASAVPNVKQVINEIKIKR